MRYTEIWLHSISRLAKQRRLEHVTIMKPSIVLASFGWLFLAAGLAIADVRDTIAERQLSLSENAPALAIPRSDWILGSERVRQDKLVVYYLLSSEGAQATFSVYINAAGACADASDCLEKALTNPSYKEAKEIERTEVGPFKAVHFYIDKPGGAPFQQTHLLASVVVKGHWFDIHLSAAGKERPSPTQLLQVLKTFSVR